MIDLNAEHILSLTDATKRLPKRRMGKRPHVATLYRWSTRGVRGVVLETIQIGGTRCTSTEALQRFAERLSCPSTSDSPRFDTSRSEHRRAERQLDAAGI